MQMRDVLLTIKGLYMRGDTHDDIEFATQAQLFCEDGVYTIVYDGPEAAIPDESKTVIRVEDHTVSVLRDAEGSIPFMFEDKTPYKTNYRAGDNFYDMLLFPTKVHTKLAEDHGKIELEYTISVDGSQAINKIDMHYAPLE